MGKIGSKTHLAELTVCRLEHAGVRIVQVVVDGDPAVPSVIEIERDSWDRAVKESNPDEIFERDDGSRYFMYWRDVLVGVAAEEKGRVCPNCRVGLDTDLDGDCPICAHIRGVREGRRG